ncbi:MAG: SAM-dependent methyltransferase [Deltaproteobacteria bacterium]|nr:SAM-dependent methyltransferase [Deltaproteobacteria bacterium]
MPYPADFFDAHSRHWRDAELLFQADRWANADQLYGFSAECGLKAVMERLGMATDDTGKPEAGEHRQHVQDLWPTFLVFAAERGGDRLASRLPGDMPFADWSQADRYAHGEHFDEGIVRPHREAASAVADMVESACQDA